MNGFAFFDLESGTPLSIFHGVNKSFSSIEGVSTLVGLYFGLEHIAKEAADSFVEKQIIVSSSANHKDVAPETPRRRLFQSGEVSATELGGGAKNEDGSDVKVENQITLEWFRTCDDQMIGCFYYCHCQQQQGRKIAVLVSFPSNSSKINFAANSALVQFIGSSLLKTYLDESSDEKNDGKKSLKKKDFCFAWLNKLLAAGSEPLKMIKQFLTDSKCSSVITSLPPSNDSNPQEVSKNYLLISTERNEIRVLDGYSLTASTCSLRTYRHLLLHTSLTSEGGNFVTEVRASHNDKESGKLCTVIAKKLSPSSSTTVRSFVEAGEVQQNKNAVTRSGDDDAYRCTAIFDAICLAVSGASSSRITNDWCVRM